MAQGMGASHRHPCLSWRCLRSLFVTATQSSDTSLGIKKEMKECFSDFVDL
jgi:hypothetical protein